MLEFVQPLTRRLQKLAIGTASLVVIGALAGPAGAQSSDFDTWLDESGQFKIEAKFLGMNDGNVNLQTKDGKTKAVPYAKLSLSSQYKVKKLSDPKAFDAPPLPSSFAPPPLPEDPFPPDATIEQYLDTMYGQVKAGNAEVLWYATHPKMRAELEALISKGAEVLGPTTFRQLQVVLPNVLTIVRDKRSFIVGHPLIAAKPEVAKAINAGLPALEPIVQLMTQKTTWNSDNFKQDKVGSWIMMFAKDMVKAYNKAQPALQAAFGKDAVPSLLEEKYKVLEKTADTAKIEVTNGKKKQVTVYKKVDGFWQPEEFEQGLQQLAEARSQLESMDQSQIDQTRTQVKTGLTVANTLLASLAKAKTQQEFNQILDPILSSIPGMQPGGGMASMGMPSTPGMSQGMTPGMSGSSGGPRPGRPSAADGGAPNSGGIPNSGGSIPNSGGPIND